MAPRLTVTAAGETATADYTVAAPAPVAGVTQKSFAVPSNALLVTPATIASVVASAPAGSVIVGRGGVYAPGLRFNYPVTFQPYLDEQVVVDGGGSSNWAAVVKAAVAFRGIWWRNFTAPAASVFDYGIEFPSGSSGSLVEQCHFSGWAGGTSGVARAPINAFSKGALTVRSCLFEATGQNHIAAGSMDGLLVELCLMLDANQSGQPAEPVTAAIKVSPSGGLTAKNVTIRNNIIDGVAGAYAIWFDTDCFDPWVINNTLTRVAKVGIQGEAVVRLNVLSNRVTGAAEGIKSYDSVGMRAWNNQVAGASLGQFVARQDSRRNSRQVTIDMGSTWITSGTELVNNDIAADYQTFQIDSMDDSSVAGYTPTQAGQNMYARIEGNRLPKGTQGTQVGWGKLDRSRTNYTMQQLEAAWPSIARNNATPMPVGLPADMAAAAGVAAGTAQIGPLMTAPVRAA